MEDFTASLIREKMTFTDTAAGREGQKPAVVRSNRIALRLKDYVGSEYVVVRAQTMHSTLLMASRLMFSFFKNGRLSGRKTPFDWKRTWESSVSTYEHDHNKDLWVACYVDGVPVLRTVQSPYMDVVEKCALLSLDNYDASIGFAEHALQQVGQQVEISHEATVASVFTDHDTTMRCGVIHRGQGRNTTFSFHAHGGTAENRIVQSLSISAAFLEFLNLQYLVRATQARIRDGEFRSSSPQAARMRDAAARMNQLNKQIAGFEEVYDVKYRPAKPEFFKGA